MTTWLCASRAVSAISSSLPPPRNVPATGSWRLACTWATIRQPEETASSSSSLASSSSDQIERPREKRGSSWMVTRMARSLGMEKRWTGREVLHADGRKLADRGSMGMADHRHEPLGGHPGMFLRREGHPPQIRRLSEPDHLPPGVIANPLLLGDKGVFQARLALQIRVNVVEAVHLPRGAGKRLGQQRARLVDDPFLVDHVHHAGVDALVEQLGLPGQADHRHLPLEQLGGGFPPPARNRLAGQRVDFQRPDDPPRVVRVDAAGRHGIDHSEPVVERFAAGAVALRPQPFAHLHVGRRRVAEPFGERLQIEPGAADDEHPFAAREDPFDGGGRDLTVLPHAEVLGGLDAVKEVVLNLGALAVGGSLREDRHLAVDLHGIAGDNLRAEKLGKFYGDGGLAHRGWTDKSDNPMHATSPKTVCAVPRVMRTGTSWPNRFSGLSTMTLWQPRVLPNHCRSKWPCPSTKISTSEPSRAWWRLRPMPSCKASRRWRASFTSRATSSSLAAAEVPGRGEYLKR